MKAFFEEVLLPHICYQFKVVVKLKLIPIHKFKMCNKFSFHCHREKKRQQRATTERCEIQSTVLSSSSNSGKKVFHFRLKRQREIEKSLAGLKK